VVKVKGCSQLVEKSRLSQARRFIGTAAPFAGWEYLAISCLSFQKNFEVSLDAY
jgi:hypothetical protein